MDSHLVDTIFLQETLGPSDLVINTLCAIRLGWNFHAIDARGLSGGLALGINPRTIRLLNVCGGEGFLGADIFSADLDREYRLMNVYGPCTARLPLWEHLLD